MAADRQIVLARLPDGEVGLRSVFKREDGKPRFIIPLPQNMIKTDPGISYMVEKECLEGGYQYRIRRFLDAHLGPDDLFIDVGAHWGIFTLTAASAHPKKVSVIAVEANPFNVSRLKKSVARNGYMQQVEIFCCALGAKMGIATLVGGRGTMGDSVDGVSYRQPGSPGAPQPSFTVPILTLDYILSERTELTNKTVFLKVDVEGFETDVLDGASQLIRSGRVAAMVIEKGSSFAQDPYLTAFGAMVDKIRAHGFKCYRFKVTHPGLLIPYELTPELCDIVCVSDRIAPLALYE